MIMVLQVLEYARRPVDGLQQIRELRRRLLSLLTQIFRVQKSLPLKILKLTP